MPGITDAVSLTLGAQHGCVLLSTGAVQCWGVNTAGELGDETTHDSPTPVDVQSVDAARSVSAGTESTCIVSHEGRVSCWGDGGVGKPAVPVSTISGAEATAVDTGPNSSCALSGGGVYCWGDSGRLGVDPGDLRVHRVPTAVIGLPADVSPR